jgi:ribonucleoside-diphosphate reductase beta chain
MSIFDKRVAFKPFEYPQVMDFVDAINHSYWLHSEFNFYSDVQDFKIALDDSERNAIKNTLLAISQIEVSVKTFWGGLYDKFPKPEFNAVGATFAESEVRHERAYSHLLEVLGLNGDFDLLLENPVIQRRVDYLHKYLKNASKDNKQLYTLTLALFSLFIENVSLFSQFAIIKSFNKEKNILKDIDNVVQATQKEEQLHALLGVYIINQIKKENPEWFDTAFYDMIDRAALKAFNAEVGIIDWIFEKGELNFLPKTVLIEFIKQRFNDSIVMIGGDTLFAIDQENLKPLAWFNDEITAQTHTDFFYKRPTTYSKKNKSVTGEDLF